MVTVTFEGREARVERLQWGWAGTVEEFLATPDEVWPSSTSCHSREVVEYP
jgi:hypothetical protein